jgi:hypothetical protein
MFKSSLLRQTATAARSSTLRTSTSSFVTRQAARGLSATSARRDQPKDDSDPNRHDELTTSGKPGAFKHEGEFSRTDKTIRIEYPDEAEMPRSAPIQGRGGSHYKRTLATFSLEGKVGVVTGGARGLGLVMSQALVVSGADVAIVDLNSTYALLDSLFDPTAEA